MDRELLNSLNNLSLSLEKVVEALGKQNESKSAVSNALVGGNFGGQLTQISKELSEIKKDNKKILKNQETILEISKENKSASGFFGSMGGGKTTKESIKQGVGTILLIAGGVLAIGLAFKIIGSVDFASVIALSISLPIIAMAFEKIALIKDLNIGNILGVMFVVTGVSLAITAASYILSKVKPIGLLQGLTAIMIAGTFAAIGPSIGELLGAFKGVSIFTAAKAMIGLPFILIAISGAIAGASHVLAYIRPIGLLQAITGILIAGMFSVIAFGISKMMQGFKDLKPADVAVIKTELPWILVGISTAIMASSWILSGIRPIGFFQFLTAVAIAIVFIPISYAIGPMLKSLKGIEYKDIAKLPLMLVAISGAIMLSSLILVNTQIIPIGTLFNIVLQSIALAVSSVVLGLSMGVLGKIPTETFLKGGIAVVIIAGAIMLSSQILSLGNYGYYPPILWSLGTGASLLAFGLATIGIGLAVSSGIGAVAILAGAAAILLVSGTIVAASYILGAGNYGTYPSPSWAGGVGISLLAFGTSMIALGTLIVATLGVGAGILAAGAGGVLMVAQSIVNTSRIISTGKYSGGPGIEWATGTGILMVAFGTAIVALGALGLFGSSIIEKGKTAVNAIAQSIVDVSGILKKGDYTKGPTTEWARGIALTLGAFSPIYVMLMANKVASLFGKSGITPEQFNTAIQTISKGIVASAETFASPEAQVAFSNGPSEAWAKGVGSAILAFAPVYKVLTDKGILSSMFGSSVTPEEMSNAISSISFGIASASLMLNLGKYDKTIPANYVTGLSQNVKEYIKLIRYIEDNDISSSDAFKSLNITASMGLMITSYDRLAKSIKNLSSSISSIDTDKILALRSLTGNVILMSLMDPDQFSKMMDAMDAKASKFVSVMDVIDKGESNRTAAVVVGQKASKEGNELKDISDKLSVLVRQMGDISSVVGSNGSLKEYLEGIHSSPKLSGQNQHSPN